MPWAQLQKNSRAEPTPWVKIGCSGRNGGWHRCTFTLNRPVVQHLGVGVGEQVCVHFGTGEHAGWMGLTKATDNDGYTLCERGFGAGVLHFAFSSAHLGVLEYHKTEKVTPDGLRLTLPIEGKVPWCKFELPAWANHWQPAGGGAEHG